MPLTVPVDIDVDYYRSLNPDLSALTADQAIGHFKHFGINEGRAPSPFALKENLLPLVTNQGSVLEIGPFTNPAVRGENVKYFDVLDRAALIERAKTHGYPTENVPNIDFVSPRADLSIVNHQFDAVFSSHAIEHQPDLVGHLLGVERILKPGGYYFLIVPDKRYCFDHFLHQSDLPEVLAAHYENRQVHTLRSVIEHRAFTTHNDARRHWRGDHGEVSAIAKRSESAVNQWKQSSGGYIDVHAWQFTPSSFEQLLGQLKQINMIGLAVARVFPTPMPRQEFCAILQCPAS